MYDGILLDKKYDNIAIFKIIIPMKQKNNNMILLTYKWTIKILQMIS